MATERITVIANGNAREKYGPFDTLSQARACAKDFDEYVILNADGSIVECKPNVPFPRFTVGV